MPLTMPITPTRPVVFSGFFAKGFSVGAINKGRQREGSRCSDIIPTTVDEGKKILTVCGRRSQHSSVPIYFSKKLSHRRDSARRPQTT